MSARHISKITAAVCLTLAAVLLLFSCTSGEMPQQPAGSSEQPAGPVEKPELFLLKETPDVFDIHTEKQRLYLEGPFTKSSLYADAKTENSRPEAIFLSFDILTNAFPDGIDEPPKEIRVCLDVSDSFPSPRVRRIAVRTDDSGTKSMLSGLGAYFTNLLLDTVYYWKVQADWGNRTYESPTASFRTNSVPPRNLCIDGVPNVRDVGGWKIDAHRRVKQGMIYRGGAFDDPNYGTHITDAGILQANEDLGIRTEIELRWISVGETDHLTSSLLGTHVGYFEYEFNYTDTKLLIGNKENIARCFRKFADESAYPIYYHCRIGTDRTGVLTFLLLGMLGVPEDDLKRDYIFSNFGNIGGWRQVSSIQSAYLDILEGYEGNTFQEKVSGYLISECGLEASVLEKIRRLMIEDF